MSPVVKPPNLPDKSALLGSEYGLSLHFGWPE